GRWGEGGAGTVPGTGRATGPQSMERRASLPAGHEARDRAGAPEGPVAGIRTWSPGLYPGAGYRPAAGADDGRGDGGRRHGAVRGATFPLRDTPGVNRNPCPAAAMNARETPSDSCWSSGERRG